MTNIIATKSILKISKIVPPMIKSVRQIKDGLYLERMKQMRAARRQHYDPPDTCQKMKLHTLSDHIPWIFHFSVSKQIESGRDESRGCRSHVTEPRTQARTYSRRRSTLGPSCRGRLAGGLYTLMAPTPALCWDSEAPLYLSGSGAICYL